MTIAALSGICWCSSIGRACCNATRNGGDETIEVWIAIEEFPQYEVSNMGAVRNRKTGRMLSGSKNNHDYWRFDLCNKGKRIVRSGHRLVANAFLPKIPGKDFVNHKDGNKSNNRVENLEWCTISENVHHSYQVLGCKPVNRIAVVCCETGEVFPSICDAAQWLGVKNGSVSRCCAGKRKTIHGYHFVYADAGVTQLGE